MNRYIKTSVKVIAVMMAFGAFPAFAGSDVAVENTQIKCTDALKGFTVGADLVYNHAKATHEQLDATLTTAGATGHDNEFDKVEHKRCCFDPSINIGYTHTYKNWYMGAAGEISFGKNSKRTTVLAEGMDADSKIDSTAYGLKIKGGYFIKDLKTAIYAIAGIKWRDVKFRFNVGSTKGSDAKLKRPLYVLGVGIERPIYKKLSVSAEYEYAWRKSDATSTVSSATGTASLFAKQRLNDHNFKIGVKYHI